MATVKIRFNKDAASTLLYVFHHTQPGDVIDGENCTPDERTLGDQFKAVRDANAFKDGNQVAHIVQSWSPEESTKFEPEAFNAMGLELAREKFPGHQVVVVTHTDREHIHNHIVVNTVNLETGDRILNKYHHLHELRAINDRICIGRGLTIPNQAATLRAARMSDKVERMVRFGRASYVMDMKQKAEFARAYATSYDEYVSLLAELGVAGRVEEKNITYFYPGQARGKRGKTMGARFDKPGLERTFRDNDEKFREHPGLRALVRGKIGRLQASPGAARQLAGELASQTGGVVQVTLSKDYSAFTKMPRRDARTVRHAERALADCMVPLDEIARARATNILDYCRRNRIGMFADMDGNWRLKGRDFVILRNFEWVNTKNHTKGSLIDFVAAHKGMTYLQATAEITGNHRLLLLEQQFGEQRRTYTSFYVPKGDRSSGPVAVAKLTSLLETSGASPRHAETLLKNHPVQVSKGGVIRFFGKDDDQGAAEYYQDEAGRWRSRHHGRPRAPFFEMQGQGRRAVVFTSPLAFLSKVLPATLASKKGSDPLLVLVSPDAGMVDAFLARHRHVEKVDLFTLDPKNPTPAERDLFSVLSARYHHLSIGVDLARDGRAMRGTGPDLPPI